MKDDQPTCQRCKAVTPDDRMVRKVVRRSDGTDAIVELCPICTETASPSELLRLFNPPEPQRAPDPGKALDDYTAAWRVAEAVGQEVTAAQDELRRSREELRRALDAMQQQRTALLDMLLEGPHPSPGGVEAIIAAINSERYMLKPPYMFSDAKNQLFPTLQTTTCGEVIEEVWRIAFDAAVDAVKRHFAGRGQA